MKTLPIIIVCLLFSEGDSDQFIVREQVGWIEHNIVVDANSGHRRLEQIIFWDVDPETGSKECRGWLPAQRVMLAGRRAIIVRGARIYIIEGQFLYSTQTSYDPEIENRKIIPLQKRRLVADAK